MYLQTKAYEDEPRGTCREIAHGIGNPAINFTGFESYMGANVFVLPGNSTLKLIDEWKDGGETKNDDRYILTNGLNDDRCSSLPEQAEDFDAPVFLIQEGLLLQWDPRLRLNRNTPDSPMTDGGGSVVTATGGETLCSNVPRTFQNFDQCIFSSEATTCGSVPSPDTTIELNSNNILQLHSLTGRYVYAIHGLMVSQDEFSFQIEHPCTPGLRSRWERDPGATCENPSDLRTSTKRALKRLISGSNDRNPYIRDITFPTSGEECDGRDNEVEIQIEVGTDCWTHVHPEHLGVWDFTYWTLPNTHPGNGVAESSDSNHPIKKWLDGGLPVLVFPSKHPMDGSFNHAMNRWDSNYQSFEYIGRFGDSVHYRDLPNELRLQQVAEYYGVSTSRHNNGVIVCGSPGEVANDPTKGSVFDVASEYLRDTTYRNQYGRQREIVWTMVALYAQDQLRQRMAWALSQILVIAKESIKVEGKSTEMFLQFYDIFVRNAFGNYIDILREISYNTLMAENLSFLQSKSSAYVWENYFRVEFADEVSVRDRMFVSTMILLNLSLRFRARLFRTLQGRLCNSSRRVSHCSTWTVLPNLMRTTKLKTFTLTLTSGRSLVHGLVLTCRSSVETMNNPMEQML